jgi:hypothetical protein
MPDTGTNEVLAYCGSCKMDLKAMIVAKVGSKIVKVQCNTCKKERAYKAPKGVTEPGQPIPGAAAPKASKRKSAAVKAEEAEAAKGVAVEIEWKRLMHEGSKAARVKYSPKAKLSLGDVIEHPSFGEGVVTRIQHPDKAEIIFQNDVKLLVHSRS